MVFTSTCLAFWCGLPGHKIRVHVLILLNEGIYTASEISRVLDVPENTLNNHLRRMLADGSVEIAKEEKQGNMIQYWPGDGAKELLGGGVQKSSHSVDWKLYNRLLIQANHRLSSPSGPKIASALGGYVLARGNEVLQLGLVPEREGDALFGQLHDLRVAVAGSRPALDVGGLGPPAVAFVVIDDADDLHDCSNSE